MDGRHRSRSEDRANLPGYLTDFVGRNDELARLTELMGRHRLVTITATAGAGKTRLAVEAAREARGSFPGGRWFVDLSARQDGGTLPLDILAAMGQVPEGGVSGLDALRHRLSVAGALLVLDNCEHLVRECADLVGAVLPSCPDTRVLATSREPLGLEGETVFRLPPMRVPAEGVRTPEEALGSESVQLFAAVAAQVEQGFAVDGANVDDVCHICRRLDGLPLAIVLAAARSTALVPAQIRARLDDRFSLLTRGRQGMPPRHQTLRGALDWSYDQLDGEARDVLLRLAVFTDGATLTAAEQVCEPRLPPARVLEVVEGLVARSLLTVDRGSAEARFGILQTIREYVLETVAAEAQGAARDGHLAWCTGVARRIGAAMHGGGREAGGVEEARREHGNLVAALAWARQRGDGQTLRLMVASLWVAWLRTGRWAEAREWLARALEVPGGDTPTRITLLLGRGFLDIRVGAYDTAEEALAEALRLATASHDLPQRCLALMYRGMMRGNRLDLDAARGDLRAALDIARELDDTSLRMRCQYNLGVLASRSGDFAEATVAYREALDLAVALGDEGIQLFLVSNLADLALGEGDPEEASRMLDRSRPLIARQTDQFAVLVAATLEARIAVVRGDLDEAWSGARRLLDLTSTITDFETAGRAFEIFAAVAARRIDLVTAARLVGAADALRAEVGPRPPNEERKLSAMAPELVRALADDSEIMAARDEGRAMAAEEAAAYVRGLALKPALPAPGAETPEAVVPTVAVAATMRREGEYWAVTFQGRTSHVRQSIGLTYLARLLSEPRVEHLSLDLAAGAAGTPRGITMATHIPLLDQQAKAEYRRRLYELAEEIDQAERDNDPERGSRRRAERDMLVRELARAVGRGERDRPALSEAERARVSVTKALRGAIARLAHADRELGDHLQACVRTGARCSYEPNPREPVVWVVSPWADPVVRA